jgi:hypothetical protein
VFCYTSWRFYAFSGTNLLTRRHSANSLFYAVFVFQKSYTWNILGIGQNKSRTSYFFRTRVGVQSRDGGGARTWPHPRAARARPWSRHQGVSPPGPPPDTALLPIYSSRWEKPKNPINFPRNLLQAATYHDQDHLCVILHVVFVGIRWILILCQVDVLNYYLYVISMLFMILHALHC